VVIGRHPSGDCIQLPHMSEPELPQERAQRRRRIHTGKQPPHPAVPQQRHVLDAVRPGEHPRHQGSHLRPGVRAPIGRHAQMLVGQAAQPHPLNQREHRDQPRRRHEIRLIEQHGHGGKLWQSCVCVMPFIVALIRSSPNPILAQRKGILVQRRDHTFDLIGGSRLSRDASFGGARFSRVASFNEAHFSCSSFLGPLRANALTMNQAVFEGPVTIHATCSTISADEVRARDYLVLTGRECDITVIGARFDKPTRIATSPDTVDFPVPAAAADDQAPRLLSVVGTDLTRHTAAVVDSTSDAGRGTPMASQVRPTP
jgi:hypothetical protein